MRKDFDEAKFREWVLKEIATSARLYKQDVEKGRPQALIHRGMIRGIRRVAQHLEIDGLEANDLAIYESVQHEGLSEAELREILNEI